MDYKAFFEDVLAWIGQVNQMAMQHGMAKPEFWQWVADSCGELSKKYQDNRLVIKQMVMLVEWLEEAYEKQKGARP
ncbi:hypothetical protein B1748_29050 [Paenibacillus sp. MY03]|uniref:hypothetical protein n=1 Tax=Paenibacillus sp. MY03 TaxID=302980 RepID=UPI000B3BE8A2|nr:hypothetical protein [Paenibacillus sp. MY03]OUS70286.1 hypothetical protein B1748_29050 [Paenibacillus sp. MY03]